MERRGWHCDREAKSYIGTDRNSSWDEFITSPEPYVSPYLYLYARVCSCVHSIDWLADCNSGKRREILSYSQIISTVSISLMEIYSFDFAINRFLIKLFKTNNIKYITSISNPNIINEFRVIFGISLLITRKTSKLISKLKFAENCICNLFYLSGSCVSLDLCTSLVHIMFIFRYYAYLNCMSVYLPMANAVS